MTKTTALSTTLIPGHANHARCAAISAPTALLIVTGLLLHAAYITLMTEPIVRVARGAPVVSVFSDTDDGRAEEPNIPDLFVFRRTKKTGSTSMANALLDALMPLGYEPLPHNFFESVAIVRNEYMRPSPRRLLVIHYNKVTRADHPRRRVIIADTIRDGYQQLMSYCRHMRRFKKCDEKLIECLESTQTDRQLYYRWAGASNETPDTYIDLPLSSAHPALSTTILRTVFPDVNLYVDKGNVRKTPCGDDHKQLREVYDRLFPELDAQVDMLRARMLQIAGYPTVTAGISVTDNESNVKMTDLLNAADRIEQQKYAKRSRRKEMFQKSAIIVKLLSVPKVWTRNHRGRLVLTQRLETAKLDNEDTNL